MPFPDQIGERRLRTRVLILSFATILVLLLFRLFYLQILSHDRYTRLARENMVRSESIPALRGRIFDRNGSLLAGNRVSFILSLEAGHPAYANRHNLKAAVAEVCRIMGHDERDLEQRALRYRDMYQPLVLARDMSQKDLAPFIERMYPIPGITIGRGPMRWYPNAKLAAHTIGYVAEVSEEELRKHEYDRGEFIGRFGLESQYESILRGKAGRTYVEVDALGRKIDLFPDLPPIPPESGADLYTSIDSELQSVAEAALSKIKIEHNRNDNQGNPMPVRGSVIAIDPWTGELLVCASLPSYDPNAFAHGLSSKEWTELIHSSNPLLNRVIQAAYPPASVFKIISSLAGLDAGFLTPDLTYNPCFGKYRFGNREFGCWKDSGHGRTDLRGAFEQSCDTYYYQMARELTLEKLLDYMGRLEMDLPTGIDLPQERGGLIPSMGWYRQHLGTKPPEGIALNLAIGQGEIILTPMQIASIVGAIVTDGVVRRPHLATRAIESNGSPLWVHDEPDTVRIHDIPPEMRQIIRELMEKVVAGDHGTAKILRHDNFRVGGKTGTSQNPHGECHALCVAAAPIDDPKLVVLVVVDEGGHGGAVAGPVIKAVLDLYLSRLAETIALEEAEADSLVSTGELTDNLPGGGE